MATDENASSSSRPKPPASAWARVKGAAARAAGAAASSGVAAAVWVGRSATSSVAGALARAGSSARGRLRDAWTGVRVSERLRAAAAAERERGAELLRSTSARLAHAGRSASQSVASAAKGTATRVIPDVTSRWRQLRNRLFGGTALLVFVYALGTATPQAVAYYRLESQRRAEHRERSDPDAPPPQRRRTWGAWLGLDGEAPTRSP
ncbi:hypothetical protein KFE25_008548 [Diacronema lutheri]|uniref:Uncharacterized protein n=1 Tax=Diacronema lutheri TaxID=2081491 RepID=A0A8J5XWU8_DIALT|nr:hypothetical protein KFE25_008548 [Diacronema lutheri]